MAGPGEVIKNRMLVHWDRGRQGRSRAGRGEPQHLCRGTGKVQGQPLVGKGGRKGPMFKLCPPLGSDWR